MILSVTRWCGILMVLPVIPLPLLFRFSRVHFSHFSPWILTQSPLHPSDFPRGNSNSTRMQIQLVQFWFWILVLMDLHFSHFVLQIGQSIYIYVSQLFMKKNWSSHEVFSTDRGHTICWFVLPTWTWCRDRRKIHMHAWLTADRGAVSVPGCASGFRILRWTLSPSRCQTLKTSKLSALNWMDLHGVVWSRHFSWSSAVLCKGFALSGKRVLQS